MSSGSWHQFQLCTVPAPDNSRAALANQQRACGSAFTACTGTLACMPACSHKPAQVSKGQLACSTLWICRRAGGAAKAGMQGLAVPMLKDNSMNLTALLACRCNQRGSIYTWREIGTAHHHQNRPPVVKKVASGTTQLHGRQAREV